jgi:hypothetical protein
MRECEGCKYSYVLREKSLFSVICGLTKSLKFLQQHGLVHRDLKDDNVMVLLLQQTTKAAPAAALPACQAFALFEPVWAC